MVAQAYPEKFQVERAVYLDRRSSASSTETASVGSSTVYMMGSLGVPVSDVRPVLQQLLLLFAVRVPVLLGPELHLSLRIAVLSELLLLQLLRRSRRRATTTAAASARATASRCLDRPTRAAATESSSTAAATRACGRRDRATPRAGESATPTSRSPGSTRGVRSAGSSGLWRQLELRLQLVFFVVVIVGVLGRVERRLLERRQWWGFRRRRTNRPAAVTMHCLTAATPRRREFFSEENSLRRCVFAVRVESTPSLRVSSAARSCRDEPARERPVRSACRHRQLRRP